MKTMKVTFIQDHQSAASGNEFYPAGRKSKQRRGAELVAMGVAVAGWGEVAPVTAQETQGEEIEPEPTITPATDWTQVSGVSDEIADALIYAGIVNPAALLAWGDITRIPGIGKARAAALTTWAEDHL